MMRRNEERGAAALELVLVFPLVIALLLFVVFCGELARARSDVDAVARDAARAAVIQRSPATAVTAAQTAANESLLSVGVACTNVSVNVDTSNFVPGGSVAVDVTCVADLQKVSLLNVPASKTFAGRFVAPVDRYRGTT